MKITKKILLSGIGLVLSLGLQLTQADDTEAKISVCHKTGSATNPFVTIEVADNPRLIQKLIAKGDSLLGSDSSCSQCGDSCSSGQTCAQNESGYQCTQTQPGCTSDSQCSSSGPFGGQCVAGECFAIGPG